MYIAAVFFVAPHAFFEPAATTTLNKQPCEGEKGGGKGAGKGKQKNNLSANNKPNPALRTGGGKGGGKGNDQGWQSNNRGRKTNNMGYSNQHQNNDQFSKIMAMHVETMARNESLQKQLEVKDASIAILKKNKKKNTGSNDGGKYTNRRANIIDSKRGISGVNNPTTQRVITSHKTSRHNTTDYHCFNRSSYPEEEEEQT